MTIYQTRTGKPIRTAVLHCAAVPADWHTRFEGVAIVREIDRWHRENGWQGIGYHFVADPFGRIYPGRDIRTPGAHVGNANTGTLGVLMIESRKITRVAESPLEWFTEPQITAVRGLLAGLKALGVSDVKGHHDFAGYQSRLCPGFNVRAADWL